MDTLQVTNTVILTLNSYSAADLPCDYVDDVAIGIPVGQYVMPVTQRNTINNLPNIGTNGQPIPYGVADAGVAIDFPFFPGYWMYQNVDDLGENTGRLYGMNTGLVNTSYKIIRGRGQIQFSEQFPSPTAILEYISDGQCVDNATKIDIRSQATIEAYSIWKNSRNKDNYQSPEAITFGREWRKLRARLSDVTLADVRQAMLKAYGQYPKN